MPSPTEVAELVWWARQFDAKPTLAVKRKGRYVLLRCPSR
jgi:Holliday junction resolvase